MATIIAGRFDTLDAAREAARLLAARLGQEHVEVFYNGPAGQHATYFDPAAAPRFVPPEPYPMASLRQYFPYLFLLSWSEAALTGLVLFLLALDRSPPGDR